MEMPADALVVEAFFEPGEPVGPVRVHRTTPFAPGGTCPPPCQGDPVLDADVSVSVDDFLIAYAPDPETAGSYEPLRGSIPRAGDLIVVRVQSAGEIATGSAVAPPVIEIDSVQVRPASAPVRAVFADSLGGVPTEGWLYPVDVSLFWSAPEDAVASDWWIRARLSPPASFPSAVIDFLLRKDDTREESALEVNGHPNIRSWQGLYAVPVANAQDALPAHVLDVALLRSGRDYARFVLSRDDPGQREPIGNVEGGIGIVAAIAIDRAEVLVEP